MKKLKMKSMLSLNKETVTQLNNEQMTNVNGGKNILSIGKECTHINDDCGGTDHTDGLFCREH